MLVLLILRTALIAQVAATDTPSSMNVAPTTAPTSQPAAAVNVQAAPTPQSSSLTESVLNTRLGQIFQGKQQITWKDVTQPVFWIDTLKNLVETVLAFIPRLIGTLIFLLVFWLIYRGIRQLAVSTMKKSEVDSSIRDMLAKLIKWSVMGIGLIIACNQLGIPIVAMLTTVSIVGLAVGFAAQETLANFIAGIVIFLDKPFKVGDWLTVDGVFCCVKRVSFRSTRLLTEDGEMVVFPNTYMLANKVTNHSDHHINRVSIDIGIAYRSSIDEARRVMLNLCRDDSRIAHTPAPEAIVVECAESSVSMKLRFWVEDESIEKKIRYEYLEKTKKAFDAAGIEIPFPHMQLFVEDTEGLRTIGKAA